MKTKLMKKEMAMGASLAVAAWGLLPAFGGIRALSHDNYGGKPEACGEEGVEVLRLGCRVRVGEAVGSG